jgi:hypothetical protein
MTNAIYYLAAGTSRSWIASAAGLVPAEPAPGANLVVVVDYADETHVPASLPQVRGADAARLRRRRLEREFPGVSLCAAIPLRQRSGDGLNDVVMIAAGTGTDGEARLAQLAEQHALRAVSTPALLVAEWLRHAKHGRQRLLVVLPTPAGLRLVFLDHGQPLLSRLTSPLAQGDTAIELARTVQYLQNTQRIERGEPVEIWFWGMTDAQVERCLPTGVPYRLGAAPTIAGLPDPQRDGLDALLLLAAERPQSIQLAPDPLRLRWFARQLRHWTHYASAAVLVAGILAAATVMWRTHGIATQTDAIRSQAAVTAAEHLRLEAEVSQRGLDFEDVRLLPDAEQALRATEVDLHEVFDIAGRAFGSRPEIVLHSLEFFSAPPAPSLAKSSRTCANESIPQVASVEVSFSLTDKLDVRRRADSLAFVRASLNALQPWRSTRASGSVGASEALVIKTGLDATIDGSEWTTCLLRGGST